MLYFIRKLPAGVQAVLFAASAIGVAVGLALLG
jgi:predicted ATPase